MNKTFRGKVLHKTHVAKAELVSNSDPLMNSKNPSKRLQFDIPTGRWRDGILDFCIIPFHPLFFLTYCWPMVALGQVMTRIKFNICGGSNSRTNRNCPSAFYIMLTVTIVNIIFQMFFSGIGQTIYLMFTFYSTMLGGGSLNAASAYASLPEMQKDESDWAFSDDQLANFFNVSDDQLANLFNGTATDDAFQKMMTSQINSQVSSQLSGSDEPSYFLGMGLFQMLVMISLYIFIMVVHTKTRNQIRRAYSIGNNMSCLGDCCCATWCGVCSICQMARHTANYHTTHRARCCTTTGLDEEWEDHDFLSVDQSAQSAPRSTSPMMV